MGAITCASRPGWCKRTTAQGRRRKKDAYGNFVFDGSPNDPQPVFRPDSLNSGGRNRKAHVQCGGERQDLIAHPLTTRGRARIEAKKVAASVMAKRKGEF